MSDTVVIKSSTCPACGTLVVPDANSAKGWFCPQCDSAKPNAKNGGTRYDQNAASAAGASSFASPNGTVAIPRPTNQGGAMGYSPSATIAMKSPILDMPPPGPNNRVSVSSQVNFGSDPQSWVGRTLNQRYRLDAFLGQGAMGSVFRGVHATLNKPFAVKVLHPSLTQDPAFKSRFFQEAQIAASVKHPGIVEVYDFGNDKDVVYFVMEFLKGETVADRLRGVGRLDPNQAVWMATSVAEAVAAAHTQGVIHRDIKPANIFIAFGDGQQEEQIKVLDFGLSKALTPRAGNVNMTVPGLVCGTPAYMSPEQAMGRRVDARSDIYSLGVVLYQLLSGAVPFDAAESVVVMGMHINQPPPPMRDVAISSKLEAALMRSLAKRPEDRFPSMAEFAKALRSSLDSLAQDVPVAPAPGNRAPAWQPSPAGLASPPSADGKGVAKPPPVLRNPIRGTSQRGQPSRSPAFKGPALKESAPQDSGQRNPSRRMKPGKKTTAEPEVELADEVPQETNKPQGPRTVLWLAIGGGAVVLAAATLLIIAMVIKKPHVDNGPRDLVTVPTALPTPPEPPPVAPPVPQEKPPPVKRPPVQDVVREPPPPRRHPSGKMTKLALNSNLSTPVEAMVGGARYTISMKKPLLVDVPSGTVHVLFHRSDPPLDCQVSLVVAEEKSMDGWRGVVLQADESVTAVGPATSEQTARKHLVCRKPK